jgi:hypothetical protein
MKNKKVIDMRSQLMLVVSVIVAIGCIVSTISVSATSGYKLGDVNHDGRVNSIDARWALRYALGLSVCDGFDAKLADWDNDGKVKSGDARNILRYGLGLDDYPEWYTAENESTETPTELLSDDIIAEPTGVPPEDITGATEAPTPATEAPATAVPTSSGETTTKETPVSPTGLIDPPTKFEKPTLFPIETTTKKQIEIPTGLFETTTRKLIIDPPTGIVSPTNPLIPSLIEPTVRPIEKPVFP